MPLPNEKKESQLDCNRCGKESHHTHHKDHNHKNNKPKNLERLCTLCHSKEHNIEPKISELRLLVISYEKLQKARITIGNSIKSFDRIDLDSPKELLDQYKSLKKLERSFEREISNYWKVNSSPIYDWMIGIDGIGDVLSAKLLSRIDFENTKSVASLWAYAGYSPDNIKSKGKKSNWNHDLKRDCYLLVNCFIKKRTPKYRDVYDYEKKKQLNSKLKLGQAHNRAIRKVAKVFLRDLYLRQAI